MTDLDRRLHAATDELRRDVAQIDPPPFEPTTRLAPLLAAAALAIAIGVFAVFTMLSADDRAVENIVTQPGALEVDEAPDEPIDDQNLVDVNQAEDAGETVEQSVAAVDATPESDVGPIPAREQSEPRPDPNLAGTFDADQLVGPVTTMGAGETTTPVDGVGAWSADGSMMLLYRRTADGSHHVVVDATTFREVAVLDIDPPDIEQVYWDGDRPTILYYAEGPQLLAYDVATDETFRRHTFEGCDEVTAGSSPAPPSFRGDFGFLCVVDGEATEMIAFHVGSKTEMRRPAIVEEAPRPSPSGDYYVAWNEDGSASVLDPNLADTGVLLELYDNSYVFVVDGDGRESVAAAIYDGPAVGTLVVLPLESGVPQVIIGPDAGDEYPPSGTRLASAPVMSELAISIAGPETTDSALAGRLLAVDLGDPAGPQVTVLGSHGSAGQFDYWSSAFVSISPSGRFLMTSSDDGGDSVNSKVLRIPD